MTGSVVDKNTGTSQAGGVFTTRSNLSVTDSLISRNQANGGAGGFGGGLTTVSGTAGTFTNARIAGNSATSLGGGLYLDLNSTLTGSMMAFPDNSAPATAGGGGRCRRR